MIAAFLRAYNDAIDDRRRQDLYRYASAAVGTRASTAVPGRGRGGASKSCARCADGRSARSPLPAPCPSRSPGWSASPAALARELYRSGIGGHTRALAFADELLAMSPAAAVGAGAQRIRASSRGRSSAMSSPRDPSRRIAAMPPFLKSTRPPLRS